MISSDLFADFKSLLDILINTDPADSDFYGVMSNIEIVLDEIQVQHGQAIYEGCDKVYLETLYDIEITEISEIKGGNYYGK